MRIMVGDLKSGVPVLEVLVEFAIHVLIPYSVLLMITRGVERHAAEQLLRAE